MFIFVVGLQIDVWHFLPVESGFVGRRFVRCSSVHHTSCSVSHVVSLNSGESDEDIVLHFCPDLWNTSVLIWWSPKISRQKSKVKLRSAKNNSENTASADKHKTQLSHSGPKVAHGASVRILHCCRSSARRRAFLRVLTSVSVARLFLFYGVELLLPTPHPQRGGPGCCFVWPLFHNNQGVPRPAIAWDHPVSV